MGRMRSSKSMRKAVPVLAGPGITEQYYFRHIQKFTDFRFKIKPRYFESVTFSQFEKIVERELFDQRIVICVFDLDETRLKPVEKRKYEAFRLKHSKNPSVIICESMPSIEYWFLLHFQETNKYFRDAKSVERELRKHLKTYIKTSHFLENEAWVKDLCSDNKRELAVRRAKAFGDDGKSFSHVYRAFEVK